MVRRLSHDSGGTSNKKMYSFNRFLFPLFWCGVFALSGCADGLIADAVPPTTAATRAPRVVVVTATPSHTPPPPTATPTRAATLTPAPTATPFITPPAADDAVEIPILMYHHLTPLAPGASELLRTWTVSPEQFTAQLDYLQAHGFHTVTLKQVADFFERGAPLPTRPLVITIDDGWLDAYTVAYPELTKRDMVAVFFVPTHYATAGGDLFVNWEQLGEMSRAGMEIGGHTISHEDLTKTDLAELRRQLTASKALMEEKLGQPVVSLSYPFGAHNARVVAETQAAGYRAAVILCCGYKQSADLLLTLPRIRVSYDDTLQDFASRLP